MNGCLRTLLLSVLILAMLFAATYLSVSFLLSLVPPPSFHPYSPPIRPVEPHLTPRTTTTTTETAIITAKSSSSPVPPVPKEPSPQNQPCPPMEPCPKIEPCPPEIPCPPCPQKELCPRVPPPCTPKEECPKVVPPPPPPYRSPLPQKLSPEGNKVLAALTRLRFSIVQKVPPREQIEREVAKIVARWSDRDLREVGEFTQCHDLNSALPVTNFVMVPVPSTTKTGREKGKAGGGKTRWLSVDRCRWFINRVKQRITRTELQTLVTREWANSFKEIGNERESKRKAAARESGVHALTEWNQIAPELHRFFTPDYYYYKQWLFSFNYLHFNPFLDHYKNNSHHM